MKEIFGIGFLCFVGGLSIGIVIMGRTLIGFNDRLDSIKNELGKIKCQK